MNKELYDQIMALVNAGFDKDFIMKIIPQQEEKTPDPAPEEAAPEASEKTPEQDTLSTGINELLSEMHSTLKSMQAANIQNSRMPEESREKPEDILASLIYPSFNQKEKSK